MFSASDNTLLSAIADSAEEVIPGAPYLDSIRVGAGCSGELTSSLELGFFAPYSALWRRGGESGN